jgi:hypothetical protein
MAPGSMRGLQLVVADAQIARQQLLDRGVEASEITVFDERDGGTFFGFADPDVDYTARFVYDYRYQGVERFEPDQLEPGT